MWSALISLLLQIWRNFLSALGTTGWGFVSIWMPSILSLVVATLTVLLHQGKRAMKDRWKQNLRTILGVTALGNFLWFGCIFVRTAISTTYRDHVLAQEQIRELNQQVQRLKAPGPFERSFVGSFAYTNTLAGFVDLRGLPNQLDPCVVKVTSPKEDVSIADAFKTMAGLLGCSVVPPPDPPVLHPVFPKDLILVHADKHNRKAEAFRGALSNTFRVSLNYDLPPGSPSDMVWVEIGTGLIWRQDHN
jgi:hypothetical protein